MNRFYAIIDLISLFTTLFLILFIAFCFIFSFSFIKRFSYKIYLGIAISDFFIHLTNLISLYYLRIEVPIIPIYSYVQLIKWKQELYLTCSFNNFINDVSNMCFIFFTTIFAFNLNNIFTSKSKYKKRGLYILMSAAIFISIFLAIPTLFISIKHEDCYGYHHIDFPFNLGFFWITYGIWVLIGVVYSSYIFIKISFKIAKMEKSKEKLIIRKQHFIKNIIRRLVFYSMTPIIIQFPFVILNTYSFFVEDSLSYSFNYILAFCASSQAVWNFLFFMFDPALKNAVSLVKNKISRKSDGSETTLSGSGSF